MPQGSVNLEVVSGPMAGTRFEFTEHDIFLVGRAEDCHARLPKDIWVSRHHFLLETNPPDVRIRDLGSQNGTHVNGTKHGGRARDETPAQAAHRVYPEVDLVDGDEIKVGTTTIQVQVITPPLCSRCGAEMPDSDSTVSSKRLCSACMYKTDSQLLQPEPARCSRCGEDASTEVRVGWQGEYICRRCREDARSQRGGILNLLREAVKRGRGRAEPVFDGYEIGPELGRGGMGVVYQATRKVDGQRVAIKVMLSNIAVNEHARKMFLREIEVLRGLHHANVVTLMESGASGSAFYFVMEYCNGGSLDKLIEERKSALSFDRATQIMLHCLHGLEHAHRLGFVHRDLKPQNILLHKERDRWQAKVTDFGLAKSFQQAGFSGMTATGSFGGTFGFMPREQLTNFKYVHPSADLWSIAATYYYLLSGDCPLDFPSNRDPIEVILHDEPVPLRRRNPNVPGTSAKVIDQALSTDPSARYPSAGELRVALEASLK